MEGGTGKKSQGLRGGKDSWGDESFVGGGRGKSGDFREWKSWEKGDVVWLESKCCEAVKKKKKDSYTSYLFLYNKVAQNLVAKPTVFTLFYGFCGPGIQEQLEGFWFRVWPEVIETC